MSSDAVWALAREMHRLESTVVSMILESMGVPERVATLPLAVTNLVVRLNHYGARPDPVPVANGVTAGLTPACSQSHGELKNRVNTRRIFCAKHETRVSAFSVLSSPTYTQ